MKIVCTKDEKESMTRVIHQSLFCLFNGATRAVCNRKCSVCEMIENEIEWEIVEDGGKE